MVQDYTIQIFGDWSAMIFVDASSLGEDNFWDVGEVTMSHKIEGDKVLHSLEGRLLLENGMEVNLIMTDVNLGFHFRGYFSHLSNLTKNILTKPLTKIVGYSDWGETSYEPEITYERLITFGTSGMICTDDPGDLYDVDNMEGPEGDDAIMMWFYTTSDSEYLEPGTYLPDVDEVEGIPFTFSTYVGWSGAYKNGTASNYGPLIDGKIDVSKVGDIYTVEFDMYDDARYPHNVKGTYKGKINIAPAVYSLHKLRLKYMPNWLNRAALDKEKSSRMGRTPSHKLIKTVK